MNPVRRVDIPIGTPRMETGGQADDLDLTTTEEDEEKDKAHQPTPIPYRTREAICDLQGGHMYTDKLPPSGGLLACGGGWDTGALEDIPECLIAYRIATALSMFLRKCTLRTRDNAGAGRVAPGERMSPRPLAAKGFLPSRSPCAPPPARRCHPLRAQGATVTG